MGRFAWSFAFVVTFVVGLAVGRAVWDAPSAAREADRLRETVSRLQQQVGTLQARLRAREGVSTLRQSGTDTDAAPGGSGGRSSDRPGTRAVMAGRGGPNVGAPAAGSASSRAESLATTASTPTVAAALDRFHRYLESTKGAVGRERWQQTRELIDDLRSMGEAGAQALMRALTTGTDMDERRAAARLLGTLQVPDALPALRDVLEREDDLLLRRAAAAGLRRLQTPDSLPVMERILTTPNEDRFVRLSAAVGLVESNRPLGVAGLTQIFDESAGDGRGREMAFRALAGLGDDRSLPFMRQLVTAPVEPGYRLRAIQYLEGRGDQQSLTALQMVMQSPTEQPSIRDAAARAHATISGR